MRFPRKSSSPRHLVFRDTPSGSQMSALQYSIPLVTHLSGLRRQACWLPKVLIPQTACSIRRRDSIGRFIPPSTVVVLEIDQQFDIVFDNAHIFARFGQAKDHAVDSNLVSVFRRGSPQQPKRFLNAWVRDFFSRIQESQDIHGRCSTTITIETSPSPVGSLFAIQIGNTLSDGVLYPSWVGPSAPWALSWFGVHMAETMFASKAMINKRDANIAFSLNKFATSTFGERDLPTLGR